MSDHPFFYNPLFDTVIQRKNYNNLCHYKNQKDNAEADSLFITYYTGILRWQLLVVGRVILTDSMWYDSIYLRKMLEADSASKANPSRHATFEALISFIKHNTALGQTPIEVRARPNHVGMFFTEFYFSSVTDYNLRNIFLEMGALLSPAPDMANLTTALQTYRRWLKDTYTLNSSEPESGKEQNNSDKRMRITAEEEKGIHTILEDTETLGNTLQEISDFSYETGNWPKLGSPNPISEAFARLRSYFEDRYPKHMIANNIYLSQIWEELKKDMPHRSTIEDALEGMKGAWGAPIIKEFYDFFEDKYTRAISDAQQLHYIDCRNVFESALFPENKKETPGRPKPMVCSVMEFLGNMTWDTFQGLYDASLKQRSAKIAKALKPSERKYVLLDEVVGGAEIDNRSLYDIIFGNHVTFLCLDNTARVCVPREFREKIDCGSTELDYQDCVLFSNSGTPYILSYFSTDFDTAAAETLLCPLKNPNVS